MSIMLLLLLSVGTLEIGCLDKTFLFNAEVLEKSILKVEKRYEKKKNIP